MVLIVIFVSVDVAGKPVSVLFESVHDGGLVVVVELVGQLVRVGDGVLHLIDVIFELVSGVDLVFDLLVLLSEGFGISHHLFDFLFAESTLVVCDSDGLGISSSLIGSGNRENRVLIELKGNFNLWNSSWSWWDSS